MKILSFPPKYFIKALVAVFPWGEGTVYSLEVGVSGNMAVKRCWEHEMAQAPFFSSWTIDLTSFSITCLIISSLAISSSEHNSKRLLAGVTASGTQVSPAVTCITKVS